MLLSPAHIGHVDTRDSPMNPTRLLYDLGQSLWLDNITRDLLDNGTLERYIDECSITGLTSNPTIFEAAISKSNSYDDEIRRISSRNLSDEQIFFEMALHDLVRAADLFFPIHQRTAGNDGFVSLEVSPMLASHTEESIATASTLHKRANRPNFFIKIPGTKAGNIAIEELTFAGVPINVTLLFSQEQYLASAEAYLRGVERRVIAGLSPDIRSVASVFISRWDRATADKIPLQMRNRLGIAIGQQAYAAYRQLLDSDHWQKLANRGARPQRLLFASTGTKDPAASDTLYISALAAPNTINTIPEETLLAVRDHGVIRELLPRNGGAYPAVFAQCEQAGLNLASIADDLQVQGASSFEKSWRNLLETIRVRREAVV